SDNTTQKRDELQSQIEEKRASLIKYQNDAAALNEKISGAGKLRESYLQRRDEIELEIKQFGLNKETTEQEIEENEKNISIKQEKLSKLKLTTNSKQEDAQRIDNELSKINTELNTQKVEYNSKTSKKKILEGMENDYEGYSRSVKAVLKAPELKRLCVYGTVSGLIEVKKDYVVAIETALGGSMQNIVVESEEDAKEAIAYLRNNNSGRATFLPITSVKGKALENANEILKENGVIGLASKLISYDKKYDGVIASLLGRVVVVDNIDNAIALSRKYGYKFRVVTIEGDILNSGGSMSGGSVNKQSGFLSRAAQIKELGADIVSLSASLRALTQKQEEFIKEKELVNTQLEAYIPMVREYEDEILKLENACVYLRQSIENDDKNRDASNSEQKKIEELLKASSEESAILLSSLRSAKNNAIEAEGSIKQLEDELKRISELKEEQSGKLMDETVRLGALQKDVEFIKSQIEALNEEIISQSEALTLKQGDIEEIKNTVTIMEKTIEEKRLLWEETQRNGEELLSVIENIDAQKEVIASKLKQIQDSNKTLTDKLLNLQQELSRIENKRVKLEMEQESIVNRLWDDYELTITSAQEERIEVEDVKAANERLYELKSAIKALGNVNVDSIEEYKAVKERYEFLSEQKKDLEKSKENLTEIIASMEELIEDHFEEQFNEINKSFSEIFSELFGGGRGRLYLSDPDNVLESGIEIEVQLPGKGLQNLNLYSGGEKSFIAIALLFAILKVKPTPFCILDEIDAALDDVNVSRFATYLKNYTENTQFIVITHRRGTMEAANILYGVTMQEKGVSKLLSLLIDDVDEKLIK
ncbi:MAG: chromosome segregation protein SMC, partial [Clostridia bacterium]|nr:chromosome segregation protein SMC [Clostridia bacterium]